MTRLLDGSIVPTTVLPRQLIVSTSESTSVLFPLVPSVDGRSVQFQYMSPASEDSDARMDHITVRLAALNPAVAEVRGSPVVITLPADDVYILSDGVWFILGCVFTLIVFIIIWCLVRCFCPPKEPVAKPVRPMQMQMLVVTPEEEDEDDDQPDDNTVPNVANIVELAPPAATDVPQLQPVPPAVFHAAPAPTSSVASASTVPPPQPAVGSVNTS